MSTQIINKFIMVSIAVSDMKKAKEFYAEKLGLEVITDYRRSDDNWWVTLTPPGGGASPHSGQSRRGRPIAGRSRYGCPRGRGEP